MLKGQCTALTGEGDHANHQQQASTTGNTELAVITLLLRHELLTIGPDQHALDLDGIRQHMKTPHLVERATWRLSGRPYEVLTVTSPPLLVPAELVAEMR